MSTSTNSDRPKGLLRAIGSVWFASLLLLLISVAMACATVFEVSHGTERALETFYKSSWFQYLLALLGVNVLAALLARYPFSRSQLGFVLAHLSILVILAGALVTKMFGVNGRVGIGEEQTVREFNDSEVQTLTIADHTGEHQATIELGRLGGKPLGEKDLSRGATAELSGVKARVLQYLPDTEVQQELKNDNPEPNPALQVSFSPSGAESPRWAFSGETTRFGMVDVLFRQIDDPAVFAGLIGPTPASQPASSKGALKITYEGQHYEIPVEECTVAAKSIGTTDATIRVLRYFTNFQLDKNDQWTNTSDKPNPAVHLEITTPQISEKRLEFAYFPDFGSMHGVQQLEGLKVTLVTTDADTVMAPVEVLRGPSGELFARFTHRDETEQVGLNPGEPVETPWPGHRFAVLQVYDHARLEKRTVPVRPVREERVPAVRVELTGPGGRQDLWLQYLRPGATTLGPERYQLVFRDRKVDLGFNVLLNRFRLGYYPGTMRPRSFESQITITDPTTGRQRAEVVSMNHPVEHGGYTFYQSSYDQRGDSFVTFLSVSRDPGRPIVFAGYGLMMLGVLLVLIRRFASQAGAQQTT